MFFTVMLLDNAHVSQQSFNRLPRNLHTRLPQFFFKIWRENPQISPTAVNRKRIFCCCVSLAVSTSIVVVLQIIYVLASMLEPDNPKGRL